MCSSKYIEYLMILSGIIGTDHFYKEFYYFEGIFSSTITWSEVDTMVGRWTLRPSSATGTGYFPSKGSNFRYRIDVKYYCFRHCYEVNNICEQIGEKLWRFPALWRHFCHRKTMLKVVGYQVSNLLYVPTNLLVTEQVRNFCQLSLVQRKIKRIFSIF